jgi:hypothetical protein
MIPASGQIWIRKDSGHECVVLAYFPAAHSVLYAARFCAQAMVMDDALWERTYEFYRETL